MNIKTLKYFENELKVSNEIKQYVKIQFLNLINDIDEIFSNEDCNKIKKIENYIVIITLDKCLWKIPQRASHWYSWKLMFCSNSHKHKAYLVFHKDMPLGSI